MNLMYESKSEYVRRKVEAHKKDTRRTHELEGTKPDEEDEYMALEVKHAAEDWWDLWEF